MAVKRKAAKAAKAKSAARKPARTKAPKGGEAFRDA